MKPFVMFLTESSTGVLTGTAIGIQASTATVSGQCDNGQASFSLNVSPSDPGQQRDFIGTYSTSGTTLTGKLTASYFGALNGDRVTTNVTVGDVRCDTLGATQKCNCGALCKQVLQTCVTGVVAKGGVIATPQPYWSVCQ